MTSVGIGLKGILSLFPVGALVAVIFWFVYVGRYSMDGPDVDDNGRTNKDRATICFQAVVAVSALYYLLHNHTRIMLDL
jgi:hypothetical protein